MSCKLWSFITLMVCICTIRNTADYGLSGAMFMLSLGCIFAYRVLNGMAPSYLDQLVPVSSLTGRRRPRLFFTDAAARPVILSVNSRPSLVSGRSLYMFWNTLPDDIQSAPSVSAFRRLLKTFMFQHSFPDVILQTPVLRSRGLRNNLGYFSHVEHLLID